MTRQLFPHSPFSHAVQQLMADWLENAVVTGESAFLPLPSKTGIFFKQLAVKLTEHEREILELPKFEGKPHLQWMQDHNDNIVVTKRALGVANEKIAGDLATRVHVSVLPCQVWERPQPNKKPVYYSVTPKAFPECSMGASDELLLEGESLARAAVFNQWVLNEDFHLEQIVSGFSRPGAAMAKAYFDFHLSNHPHHSGYVPLLSQRRKDPEAAFVSIPVDVKKHVAEQIRSSPSIGKLIRTIEEVPDSVIADTVNRLPDALFTALDSKQGKISRLCQNRDHLQENLEFTTRSFVRVRTRGWKL